jgi:putative transposase
MVFLTTKRFIFLSSGKSGNEEIIENAHVESFFNTRNTEEVSLKEYETFEDTLENILRFMNDVYAEKRMHSVLGYQAPMEFKRRNGFNTPV